MKPFVTELPPPLPGITIPVGIRVHLGRTPPLHSAFDQPVRVWESPWQTTSFWAATSTTPSEQQRVGMLSKCWALCQWVFDWISDGCALVLMILLLVLMKVPFGLYSFLSWLF